MAMNAYARTEMNMRCIPTLILKNRAYERMNEAKRSFEHR